MEGINYTVERPPDRDVSIFFFAAGRDNLHTVSHTKDKSCQPDVKNLKGREIDNAFQINHTYIGL